MKKYTCFTHYDLDGVVSYITLRWALGPFDSVQQSTARRFREDYTKWLINNNPDDYDKIYITDLDVSEHKDLIDRDNVFIIDHHKSHEENAGYKKATAVVKEYKSAAELIYKVFRKLNNLELTQEQKKLILYTSDYDSYELQLSESVKLNSIFWHTNKGFDSFVKHFSKGFYGYTVEQESIYKFYKEVIDRVREQLSVYSGTFKIQGKERIVCAAFADKNINEVADFLLKDFNAEVALVVNTKGNHVSLRRPKTGSDVDVSLLSAKLCNGAGHEYAAGGEITEKFLQFTKLLKQVK